MQITDLGSKSLPLDTAALRPGRERLTTHSCRAAAWVGLGGCITLLALSLSVLVSQVTS